MAAQFKLYLTRTNVRGTNGTFLLLFITTCTVQSSRLLYA